MSVRVIRFGTIVTTNRDFHDAEFTDLTCTTLAVKVNNPKFMKGVDSKDQQYLVKLTPTNPKYADDIMEYVLEHHDNPECKEWWDASWTLPQVKKNE